MNTDDLPPGWAWATIHQIGTVITGSTPPKTSSESFGGAVPFYKPTDLNAGYNVCNSADTLSEAGAAHSRLFPANTVLVTCIGATIGKTGLARQAGASNQQINAIVATPETVLPEWCYWAISSSFGQSQIHENSSATTLPIINKSKFEQIRLPVAPLPEQRRIVARIEELFAELDAAVEELERVRANLKRYRASVLKAAVTGDLTADWRAAHPNVEPASVLLDRILTDRRAKWEADQLAKFAADQKTPPKNWQAKYAEPSKPDTSKLPTLPDGSCWANLEQLTSEARPICYGILMPKENVPTGVLFVKVRDMKGDVIDLDGLHRTTHEIASQYARASLLAGDWLLSIRGTFGRVALVPPELDGGNITQDTARLAVSSLALGSYVALHLRSSASQQYFKKVARGVAVKGVNIADVRTAPIALPPLAEQEAIVLEVEARLSDVTAAEAVVNANLTRAARLRQSILKEAFAGRLVSQDPADEPAAVLLERIRAAKPTANPAKTPRGRKATAEVNEAVVDVLAFAVPTATEAGSLNRTKIQKFAAVLQTHHGVEIVARFLQAPFGPYAPELEEMEPVCGERGFFTSQKQPKGEDGFEVAYIAGENAEAGRTAGVKRLGENTANAEQLLRLIRSMTTDEAELFATVYAVWNDLLLDGKPVDAAALVAGVYAWNVKKRKFTPPTIAAMIGRIRTEGYEPTGRGKHTEPTRPKPGRKKATPAE